MDRKPDTHSVRRIALPSGRAIEVVRFSLGDAPSDGLQHPATVTETASELTPDRASQFAGHPVTDVGATPGYSHLATVVAPNTSFASPSVIDRGGLLQLANARFTNPSLTSPTLFDGSLTVREKLVIHSTGKVTGKIRYGKIIIEEGGQLSGEITFGAAPAGSSKSAATLQAAA